MLFSSNIFLFYFLPTILILYYIFIKNIFIKNMILLIFSLIFYAWGEPSFVLIMLMSILINYILGILISTRKKSDNKKFESKLILVVMIIANLGILFVFKYLAFTIDIINNGFGADMIIPKIALPIGISFFTFQAMSYVIDVYREDAYPQKNIFYLALYISFFPQLIAGPIIRYQSVAQQILYRKESVTKFSIGFCRFITGLAKKIIISNNMAIVTDTIYSLIEFGPIPVSLAWLGSFAYTFQIFFDFSAYSDMAIGLGLMFGFKFEENFNFPYISKSISEFWRRWHISLGNWFKSYVYFPLGGSRVKKKDIMVRNLLCVWLLTGIWHGAEWNFILWGFLNFAIIFLEKLFNIDQIKVPNYIRHIVTMFIVNLGWVLFRAANLNEASLYLTSMFSFTAVMNNGYTFMFIKEYLIIFIIAIILSMPVVKRVNYFISENEKLSNIFNILYPIWILTLLVICISYLVVGSYNPFIYFNF